MLLVAGYAGCVDDGYPKRQIYVSKPYHCTYIQFVPLHMNAFKAFFGLLPTLVDFTVGIPGGTTNIQLIFDICPCFVTDVVGCCSHSVPYVGFQLLKIVVFDPVDDVLHIIPQK